jgi:hypothetical protein
MEIKVYHKVYNGKEHVANINLTASFIPLFKSIGSALEEVSHEVKKMCVQQNQPFTLIRQEKYVNLKTGATVCL